MAGLNWNQNSGMWDNVPKTPPPETAESGEVYPFYDAHGTKVPISYHNYNPYSGSPYIAGTSYVRQRIREDAYRLMQSSCGNPSLHFRGRIDPHAVVELIYQFACQQVDKQRTEMQKQIQQLQEAYSYEVAHMSSLIQAERMKSNAVPKRAELPVHRVPEGRLFREAEDNP